MSTDAKPKVTMDEAVRLLKDLTSPHTFPRWRAHNEAVQFIQQYEESKQS